mmetsp:Transcript_2551/g.6484  ORF Transcript_2551/g.6484 Transcript_2551/m.6484 type:complete len:364 (+) Transcript_2551:50-1141(+)
MLKPFGWPFGWPCTGHCERTLPSKPVPRGLRVSPALHKDGPGHTRMRQTKDRKRMQEEQQQQYRKEMQQTSKLSEQDSGTVVYELVERSPSSSVVQAQERHRAEFNATLQQRIAGCSNWQQLAGMVAELLQGGMSRDLVNYISVSQLCERLGALVGPGREGRAGKEAAEGETRLHAQSLAFDREQYAQLREELAGMASEHISWFNSQHFAQVATGLAAAGHADAPFWAAMEAASERRLLSFSGHHLAQLMVALATSGHVPSLNWLQRTEIQASKHWRAMSPGALAGTVWAWGRLNYTPSRSFLEVLKQRLRGMMRRQQLGCQQLLQVLYGMARLTRDHPRDAWLHAWCEEFQPHMGQLPAEIQ